VTGQEDAMLNSNAYSGSKKIEQEVVFFERKEKVARNN
jgi:hypothetical protein